MRLTKTRKTRSYNSPVSRHLDERSYPRPDGWIWTRIVELGVTNPRNHFPDKQPASFASMRMIPAEYGKSNLHGERPWGEIKREYTHIAEGDAGLAKITPCFENGKSVVFRNLTGGSGTTALHIVRPLLVCRDHTLLILKCPYLHPSRYFKADGHSRAETVCRLSISQILPFLASSRRTTPHRSQGRRTDVAP